MKRHETLLARHDTLLLIVDFQERLIPAMHRGKDTTVTISKLIQGMNIVQVPILVTEQYPKGLGHTVPELSAHLDHPTVISKTSFSCCGSSEVWDVLKEWNRKQVIVAGIEAHVCVLQTALDLTANDFQVHVPVDAVTSRTPGNYQNALSRMRQSGVILTNYESVLFELMIRAGTAEFKDMQPLIV